MRNTIFLSIIDRALAVCILIACVLVLRTILKKAPRRMLLLLWLPVALRLLSPMTAQSRFSLLPTSLSQSLSAYFHAEETTSETPQTGKSQIGTQPGMSLSDDFQTNKGQSGTQTGTNPSGDLQNPSNPVSVASSPKASDSKLPGQTALPDAAKLPNNGDLSAAPKKTLFLKTASTVWFAGVLLLAAYVLFELLRLRRLTKIARVQEIDGIPVYFGEHIPAPFLYGLFTPRIYLPDGLAAEYLPSVLAHERMHKNGRDNLLKPLAFLITVIYWFHPLVWLSYIIFCKDLELACDERVISTLDTDGRKEYSQTLLAISTMPRTVCGYPVAFGETDVARRIQHILSFRKPKKAFTVLCVLTCVTLTACFSTNPKGSGELSASGKSTPTSAVKPTVGNTDPFVFGTEGTDESGLPEEEIIFDFSTAFSLGKDGILYHGGDLLYITDYATGVTVPLCDKPNCAHKPKSGTNENQCNAVFQDRIETAFLYHDKLYAFVSDGLNHTIVYMAESTGEGRRKIAEADYTFAGHLEFRDGKLYFPAQRESYQEDGSLRQEREVFIGSFDTNNQSFENLTTPELGAINLNGITSREIFFRRSTYLDDERKDLSVEYIAKNLETGEERNFFEGEDIVNHIGDYCIVETGIYYTLDKGQTYEYWKKETDGDEVFIYSADHLENFRPIINGEPLFGKDKSGFQKELVGLCTCGDIILVMDTRKGSRHGIMTIDNYLNDIDEIVYPEFPNMTYISTE